MCEYNTLINPKRRFTCLKCGSLKRALEPDSEVTTDSPEWPKHCEVPMQLLGSRSSQIAAQLNEPTGCYHHNRTFACSKCGDLKRAPQPDSDAGTDSPEWPKHCKIPMQLLGYRSSQAATQLNAQERVQWLALGAKIKEGKGRKKWLPIFKEARLKDAWPLV